MRRGAWHWIPRVPTFLGAAHSLSSPAVIMEPFPRLGDPPCDSFCSGMFAERAGLGPQYRLVSSDRSWILGLSVLGGKDMCLYTRT